ncbi:type II and III secretion system protein family protein [Azospirillum sp.]|uniref:type II and III secretion system protein family protein n=1 Tax=Azospirillum sp. TaxID=34012 RepID=UPI002D2B077B|nr:type II and III secretion system protein family protein [Azospirillum sp.]HYD69882.1 type II and III secretion system protein family protein [Azospirillum sp.]
MDAFFSATAARLGRLRAVGLALLVGLALFVLPAFAAPADAAEQSITLSMTKARSFDLPVDVRDVLIANPDIADVVVKSSRQVYVIAKAVGDTNAFFLDEGGNQVLKLDIRVEADLRAVREAIGTLMPDADIEVRAVNQNIALVGTVGSAVAAENARAIARRFVAGDNNVINMLKVSGSQQVVIRVRVAEVRRTVAKKLGVNLLAQDGGRFSFQTFGGGVTNTFGQIAHRGATFGLENLEVAVQALEKDGLLKTLAEPNLTALSGENASFLAGGEFPVPVGRSEDERGTTVTIEFKQFGIGLNFTPVVLDGGRISLRIATEVSELSTEGAIRLSDLVIPALAVRRANTTVEIPSGGSLVLAGLLNNRMTNEINGLPFLADIPVLGALFRSPQFQRDETELVVIATPYIVSPTAPDRLALPTDGFAPASDIDLFLFGRLYSRYADPAKAPPPPTDRPVGYIME